MMRDSQGSTQQSHPARAMVQRFFNALVTPSERFDTSVQLLRARVFMLLLFSSTFYGVFLSLGLLQLPYTRAIGIMMLVAVPIYLVLRFVSFDTGKYLVIFVTPSIIFVDALLNPTAYTIQLVTATTVIALLMGVFVLPWRLIVVASVYFAFCITLLLLVDPLGEPLAIAIHVLVAMGSYALAIAIAWLWDATTLPPGVPIQNIQAFELLFPGFGYILKGSAATYYLDTVYGNFLQITQLSRENLLAQQGWERLVVSGDVDLFRKRIAHALALGAHTVEYRLRTATGVTCWVSDSLRVEQDTNGGNAILLGVVQDITERTQAEQTLRTHIIRQAVVAELGLLALSYKDVRQLAAHATSLVEQVLDISSCEIMELHAETGALQIIAASGTVVRNTTRLAPESSPNPWQEAVRTAERVVMQDIPQDARYADVPWFRQINARQGVTLPISGAQSPWGVLSAISTRQAHFMDEEVYFLQAVINIIATFVERKRSHENEHNQIKITNAMMEATSMIVSELALKDVLDRILQSVVGIFPCHEASSLLLLDETSGRMRFVTQRGFDEDATKLENIVINPLDVPKYTTMLQTGYEVVGDVRQDASWATLDVGNWIQSTMRAPIVARGKFVGVIHVDSGRLNAFTDYDGKILKAFANKAGVAILNARRAEELERLVSERTAQLHQERQQLQAILDATGEGIYFTERGRILYANHALLEMTGFTREELIGSNSAMLHPNGDTTEVVFASRQALKQLSDESTWRNEGHVMCKDGKQLLAELTTSLLDDSMLRESPFSAVTVVRDISRQKQMEAQQRLFISHAAHELRTPITNLNTRVYLMEKAPDRMPEHIEVLKRVIIRMNRLVSDLLDMAYIERGTLILQKQSVLMQAVIEDTLHLMRQEADRKQISLRSDMPDAPINIVADPHRIQQVLTNLIINAILYTPDAGAITVRLSQDAHNAIASVIDTGEGIPPASLLSIFNPFFRLETKQAGTGLGLTISQEIVQAHGGTITVTSVLGQGSTFVVSLPL